MPEAESFPARLVVATALGGNGGRHLIWIDPKRDLVIVSRWGENVERLPALISRATPDFRGTQMPRVFPGEVTLSATVVGALR
jgi:hypothetical protein